MNEPDSASSSRIYGLDILRSCAILTVVHGHGYNLISQHISRYPYNLVTFDGVSIFFVLSGFLIGTILLKLITRTAFTGKDLYLFWMRRWFRTLPNYFLVLLLLITAAVIRHKLPPDVWQYFFFSQNLFSSHPRFFPEAWSLSVEEWFYLMVPLLLFLSIKYWRGSTRESVVLFWIILVIVAVSLFRVFRVAHYGFADIGAWDLGLRKQVVTRMDSIMFGFLGAYLSFYKRKVWTLYQWPLLYLGLSILAFDRIVADVDNPIYRDYFTLTASGLGTLCLLPRLSNLKARDGLLVKFFTFVSLISYSMYLLHYSFVQYGLLPLIFKLAPGVGLGQSLGKVFLYWTLTIGLSYVVYRYFEKPVMNIRERLAFNQKTAIARVVPN